MAKPYQVRGMLLEEAILKLLQRSGYRTVSSSVGDPTLSGDFPVLRVSGRGNDHQIDAIADFALGYPFVNPQRLLVEAKAYDENRKVGIDRVRNGVGVLTDVSQFFFGRDQPELATWRYHYQYVIVSTSAFSPEAQRYAFAHDIALIPLGESALFRPIRDVLFQVTDELGGQDENVVEDLSELRRTIRTALQTGDQYREDRPFVGEPYDAFMGVLRDFSGAVIAMIAGRLPVLLIPAPGVDLSQLRAVEEVEISWNDDGWYLRQPGGDLPWFSFDLPEVLAREYMNAEGALGGADAFALKEGPLSEIHGFVVRENHAGVVVFRLAPAWLERLRQRFA